MAAERGGARRVELCGSLLEGGVTPSAGLIATVRQKISIGLHVMIRPRAGDFCYTADEIDVMRRDVLMAKQLGADGVVFGILDLDANVDIEKTRAPGRSRAAACRLPSIGPSICPPIFAGR